MPSLTFKELRKALSHDEIILVLGEDENGGIKIVKNYGEGTEHVVAFSMAKIHKSEHPYLLFIKTL